MPVSQIIDNNGAGTAYEFVTLKGVILPMGQVLEEVTRANVDGQAYRERGKRGEPFPMEGTLDCLDATDAGNQINLLCALQGTVVTVYDDHGNYAEDVVVLRAKPVATKAIGACAGGTLDGTATYLVVMAFTFIIAHPPAPPGP